MSDWGARVIAEAIKFLGLCLLFRGDKLKALELHAKYKKDKP